MGQCLGKTVKNNDFLQKYVALKKGTFNGTKENNLIDIEFWSKVIDYENYKIELGSTF